MNNILYSRTSGQGADLVLLHGLFGHGTNSRSVARALEADFRLHCLDLPDHGRSPWLAKASLATYASAVLGWMDQHELSAAHILGDSLDGKVAMEPALTEPGRIERLVAAEMAPVTYTEHHQVIIDALQHVAARGCQTRTEAEALLGDVIDDQGVLGYLLMSLAPSEAEPFQGPTLFLKGSESAYIQALQQPEIQRRPP